MANYSAADVKTLRDRLGAGMLDSKNALVEADGDIEKAIEILRLKGQKGNAKRGDRSTAEGLVAATEEDGAAAAFFAGSDPYLGLDLDFVRSMDEIKAIGVPVAPSELDLAAGALFYPEHSMNHSVRMPSFLS